MLPWVTGAGLGSMQFMFKDEWSNLMSLERPFLLEFVVLGDRAAWHRGPSLRSPAQVYPIAIKEMYWEPIRQSVVAFALPPSQHTEAKADESAPVITYISRQKTGRRLRDEDHEDLVTALYRLGRDYGYKVSRFSLRVGPHFSLGTDQHTADGRDGQSLSSRTSESHDYSPRGSRQWALWPIVAPAIAQNNSNRDVFREGFCL